MNRATRPHIDLPQTPDVCVTAALRLLETTDLHANLLPYDYFGGQGAQPYGLARTATLIRQARAECANTLLLDNGDALQGTPLGDITAQDGSGWTGPHPVIAAMNLLGYDAAAPGNHEFNFGLDWLTRMLKTATFPFTCANVRRASGRRFLPDFLLLERELRTDCGARAPIRIGVAGLVPPQITTWDEYHLHGRLQSRDMVATARRLVPRMRRAGADLVILLAHSGIAPQTDRAMPENAALPLAAIPGVDALLLGHTHGIFPGPQAPALPGVDPVAGTLHGVPAVMAGFRGSHLGVLDLRLMRRAGRWQVMRHHVEARPVRAPGAPRAVALDRALTSTLAAAHRMTVRLSAQPIGQSDRALHSYLALAQCSAPVRLVARAQQLALRAALHGTPDARLPILAAAAPFKTGGRAGPLHYTDIPAGRLSLRNAADLYPFPNTLCGLRVTGAQLRDWLERAASRFNRIAPGGGDQVLCDPAMPGHDFDTIAGLSYRIDLSQPPRYGPGGGLRDTQARRITAMTCDGRPVADTDRFILATNSYRAFGGGPYPRHPDTDFVHVGKRPVRDLVAEHIRNAGDAAPCAWRFAPMPGTAVLLDTGPGVRRHKADLAALGAQDCGDTPQGFARLRLPL